MRVQQVIDGEWWPLKSKERVICCDCGLAHDIEVRRKRGKLYTRWWRNDRSTAAVRREKKRGHAN